MWMRIRHIQCISYWRSMNRWRHFKKPPIGILLSVWNLHFCIFIKTHQHDSMRPYPSMYAAAVQGQNATRLSRLMNQATDPGVQGLAMRFVGLGRIGCNVLGTLHCGMAKNGFLSHHYGSIVIFWSGGCLFHQQGLWMINSLTTLSRLETMLVSVGFHARFFFLFLNFSFGKHQKPRYYRGVRTVTDVEPCSKWCPTLKSTWKTPLIYLSCEKHPGCLGLVGGRTALGYWIVIIIAH